MFSFLNNKFNFFFSILLVVAGCRVDERHLPENGYPKEVNKIITANCAVSGCHVEATKENCENISLETWERLFEGGEDGAIVIPYRADVSLLFLHSNTDTTLGLSLEPRMPYKRTPLSREEILTLKSWIDNGAPDENGFVKFSDNPDRQKFYVANQGCDVVTVFDAETKLAMRYIDVGNSKSIEAPHMLRISPDNKYWYVIFSSAGNVIQKFDAATDKFVGEINIGNGNWNTFTISHNGKKAYIVNWSSDGSIAYVDLEKMQLLKLYQGSGLFFFPHGIAANKNFSTLYVTAQIGNFIYKIDTTEDNFIDYKKITLDGQPVNTNSSLDPHEIVFSPDYTKYFVTCQTSNEVRVMQTSNDSLLAVIPVGRYPLEMSLSKTMPYLFVTCMETPCSEPACKGSVAVIDYNTNTKIKEITGGFFQPHGLAVDDKNGVIYVASRNVDTNGPAPHHLGICGGRNGFVTFIDLKTLEIVEEQKTEISVDPYAVAVRN